MPIRKYKCMVCGKSKSGSHIAKITEHGFICKSCWKSRSNLRTTGSKSKSKRSLNPRSNPPTVIYGRILRIEAEKTQPHKCDAACKRSGHRYFHDFKKSSKATIIGMPAGTDSKDRSLRIVSRAKD